jgi:hypothetical protein
MISFDTNSLLGFNPYDHLLRLGYNKEGEQVLYAEEKGWFLLRFFRVLFHKNQYKLEKIAQALSTCPDTVVKEHVYQVLTVRSWEKWETNAKQRTIFESRIASLRPEGPQPVSLGITVPGVIGPEEGLRVLEARFDPEQTNFVRELCQTSLRLRCRQIRGDGHCAFRALSGWMLATIRPERLLQIIHENGEAILHNPELQELPLAQIIENAETAVRLFQQNDGIFKHQSDALVLFLRILAVHKVLARSAELPIEENHKDYIAHMSSMEGKGSGFGGERELGALMTDVFGVPFFVLNFTAITKPSGYAVAHIDSFLQEKNIGFLGAAEHELRARLLLGFADELKRIRQLPETEDKLTPLQALRQRISDSDAEERRKRTRNCLSELTKLEEASPIFSFLGNGHYDLIRKVPS